MIITKYQKFVEFISESLSKIQNISEDYPQSFNFEEFKNLNRFAKKIAYCENNLQRISSGTSRIVYRIDKEKVLKLAKNTKGFEQNKNEILYSNEPYIGDILAKVFDYSENGSWIEMEFATKMKLSDFKRITGFSFSDYVEALSNYHNHTLGKNKYMMSKYSIDPELVDEMWDNDFIRDVFDLLGNFDFGFGDLCRISTYGIVKRDGEESIVIIDYGLTNDTYNSHYIK